MIKHRLFEQWLGGTECKNGYGRNKRHIVAENDEFILFKHDSHPTYTGRFGGLKTCEAYAALYRKTDIASDAAWYDFSTGGRYLHIWENCGRLTTKRLLKEANEKFNIIFYENYQSSEWREVEEYFSPEVQKLLDEVEKLRSSNFK